MAKNGYTVGLYTLGCKVSQYETEAVAEAFERAGFTVSPFDAVCDVYVINTCTVTAESDRKSRQIIRRAVQRNPAAVVMACGCYAQTSGASVARIPGVAYVSGSAHKTELPARALSLLSARPGGALCEVSDIGQEPFEPMAITRAPRTRAYVKIEDGCECRCTYCAIPAARGSVRSKAPADVVREVMGLARGGTREVVLTGIETASYGTDLGGVRLIDLFEMLDAEPGVPRLRLGSLTPELIRPDFVARYAALGHAAPHLHLSVQSGADPVLRAMRRRYNRAMALSAIAALRAAIPAMQFTTDLMVGFPGEREEDFADTMDLVRQARFLAVHTFAYSARPGTPAAAFPDQIPPAVRHRRSAELIALSDAVGAAELDAVVAAARPLSVLFETSEDGRFTGHSAEYIEVTVPDTGEDLHGRIVPVLPDVREGGVLRGHILHESYTKRR